MSVLILPPLRDDRQKVPCDVGESSVLYSPDGNIRFDCMVKHNSVYRVPKQDVPCEGSDNAAHDARERVTNELYDRLKPFQETIQAIQNEIYSAACLADNDTKNNLIVAYHSLRLGWYALERDEADKVKEILARVNQEADNLTK